MAPVLRYEGKTVEPLAPLPIAFDPVSHSYTWTPTGQRLTQSVTGILRASKPKSALRTFEKTKHIWAPRGTFVHSCLEQFLSGVAYDELINSPYDDWVVPLLNYPLWEQFEPLALEYRVCDLQRNIGGSLDVLGFDHLTDRVVLLDLKTMGRGGKEYSTDAQLGGYLSMLIDRQKMVVDECLTIWAGKGSTHLGKAQTPAQCLDAWETAYDIWSKSVETL